MFVSYKGTGVYYNVYGSGERLLVFLHGWGTNQQTFMPLIQALTQFNFSCLGIDFPPFGKSQQPNSAWNLDDYKALTAQIINEVQKENDFKDISIIAHSFGGRVAIKLANEMKLDNLVLLSSAGIKPRFSLVRNIKIYRYKFLKKIGSKKAEKCGSSDYKILSDNMKKTFSNIINEDLTGICKSVSSPTLIISGTKDKETPPYMASKIHKQIWGSKLVMVKDAGHFAYMEKPSTIFPIICSFLL